MKSILQYWERVLHKKILLLWLLYHPWWGGGSPIGAVGLNIFRVSVRPHASACALLGGWF